MAHTKELLDAVDITDLVDTIVVTQDIFTDENGKQVRYNRLVLNLKNDDDLKLKLDKTSKVGVYYALREASE